MTYVFFRPRHLKERNAPKMVKTIHLRKTEIDNQDLSKTRSRFRVQKDNKKVGQVDPEMNLSTWFCSIFRSGLPESVNLQLI